MVLRSRRPPLAASRVAPRGASRAAPRAAVVGIVLAVAGALVGAVAAPAGAHGGPGAVVLAGTLADDGRSVHIEATITYTNDGEPAERATVTVSGTDATGATTEPVALVPGDVVGTYVGDLAVPPPGRWSFVVVSSFPPATMAFPMDVDATGAVDLGLTAPVAGPTTGDDDGRGVLPWVGVGVAAGVVALGAVWLARRVRGGRSEVRRFT